MKQPYAIFLFLLMVLTLSYSCQKQEYFKSESGIKKELQGKWNMIPIPKYDSINGGVQVHTESWTFNDTHVTIVNNGETGSSSYSVHTTIGKAEVKLDGVAPPLVSPARVRDNNGTWQIVKLDDSFLIIANDHDGSTGLTELEFQKQ